MASDAQAIANYANAQLSTGPRSEAGKEIAKANSLKHGLTGEQIVIKGESSADYDRQRAQLFESYAPAGAVEQMLVERISQCWWRLERAERLEPKITMELGEITVFTDDKVAKKYSLFLRYRTAIERAWKHAIRELQKLQTARARQQAALAEVAAARNILAARQQFQSKAPVTPIGFVSKLPHPSESLPLSCRL